MDKNNKELKQYFKAIKKETHIYPNSSRFLKDMQSEIYSDIANNPDICIEDIYKKYGTCNELASEFFQQMDADAFKKKTSLARTIKCFFLICLLVFTTLLSLLFIDRQIHRPAIIKYYIETTS